jgi:3-phenylpropionate/trans-cinnamate dioxygenase ferredoxin reductase component
MGRGGQDTRERTLVIVGAGHAGGAMAAKLRSHGYGGPITLIGAEATPPYRRPPLSKAWLKGEVDAGDLYLRPLGFYKERAIELLLSTRVKRVDRDARTVLTGDGREIPYAALVLATGARPRMPAIPGIELEGVVPLRTIVDAERIKQKLGSNSRVVVVGGGYVGLEVASAARSLGTDVAILEREARLLPRAASESVSQFFAYEHARRGVTIRLRKTAIRILPAAGASEHVAAVQLDDGDQIPCDLVIVGVGITPRLELAESCGLVCDNGVVVDDCGRTSDPQIYAIGDVTHRPLWNGGTERLESVPSALELAERAAAHIAGRPARPMTVPWFWSDQYDLKLQIAGLRPSESTGVVSGDPDTRSFSVWHFTEGRVAAIECINAPREFARARRLIADGTPVNLPP